MVTTDDAELAKQLRGIRQWGSESGTWGSSYKMTKVQAAVGSVQLRRLDAMIEQRVKRARDRLQMLEGIPELTLTFEPPECDHTFYLFTLLVPPEWGGEKRDRLCQMLREEYNVGTMVANPPVWEDQPYINAQTSDQIETLPVSVETAKRLFCISLHPLMSEEENAYVVAAVWDAVESMRKT